jgi:hypothetical protein
MPRNVKLAHSTAGLRLEDWPHWQRWRTGRLPDPATAGLESYLGVGILQ